MYNKKLKPLANSFYGGTKANSSYYNVSLHVFFVCTWLYEGRDYMILQSIVHVLQENCDNKTAPKNLTCLIILTLLEACLYKTFLKMMPQLALY